MSTPTRTDPALVGALRLADWGVIRARGADAQSFLHSQLTNDMLHLEAGEVRLAGYCSPKGRMLASFVVWKDEAGDVLLACSAEILPATLKRLSMFVLRAKCKLDDASAEWPLWGLAGPAALAASPTPLNVWHSSGDGRVLRLPDAQAAGTPVPRLLWAGAEPPPALGALQADTWRWLEVMSAVPRVVGATVEQFVPQMVNLELVGGVDFRKGCYPGQEVVARSQYRGTLKRRAYVLEGDAALAPGMEIFHADDPGQPAGMVALAGAHGARHAALAELKIAATSAGTLHAGSADGPLLRVGTLPYAIPADTA